MHRWWSSGGGESSTVQWSKQKDEGTSGDWVVRDSPSEKWHWVRDRNGIRERISHKAIGNFCQRALRYVEKGQVSQAAKKSRWHQQREKSKTCQGRSQRDVMSMSWGHLSILWLWGHMGIEELLTQGFTQRGSLWQGEAGWVLSLQYPTSAEKVGHTKQVLFHNWYLGRMHTSFLDASSACLEITSLTFAMSLLKRCYSVETRPKRVAGLGSTS